jgi:uncharacterized protein YdhG (YjbR/CyaY superfamily)
VSVAFATVDEYIASYPEDVRTVLEEVRRTIRDVVPDGEEMISYQIPTVTVDSRYLVYFAAWKHHLSVYPIPRGDEALDRELAPYLASKGTLRFPYDRPIPYPLIKRVAQALLAQRRGEQQ